MAGIMYKMALFGIETTGIMVLKGRTLKIDVPVVMSNMVGPIWIAENKINAGFGTLIGGVKTQINMILSLNVF